VVATNAASATAGGLGQEVCGGSKHYGDSFLQVAEDDPGYIGWAIAKTEQDGAQGWVKKLAEWGKAHGFTASSGRAQQQRQQQAPPLRRGVPTAPPVASYAIAPNGVAEPPKRERGVDADDPPMAKASRSLVRSRAEYTPTRLNTTRPKSKFAWELTNGSDDMVHATWDPAQRQTFWISKCHEARAYRDGHDLACFKLDIADQSAAGFDEDAHRRARGNALDGAEAGTYWLDHCWQMLLQSDLLLLEAQARAAAAPAPGGFIPEGAIAPHRQAATLAPEPDAAPAAESKPWAQVGHFTVGNMTSNPEWSGRRFDDVYENAHPKVWQWMLNKASTAKWFAQFVDYARSRAASEGRDIEAPAKAPRLPGR
jgi:hypothetical protein